MPKAGTQWESQAAAEDKHLVQIPTGSQVDSCFVQRLQEV